MTINSPPEATGLYGARDFDGVPPRDGGLSILDVAFGILLFLTATDLYRFIALWTGLGSFAAIGGVFTLTAVGYTLHFAGYTNMPPSRLMGWTAFLLLVPVGSLAYSPNPDFRNIALQVFYLFLLWASKVFFSRDCTRSLTKRLLDLALVVGFVGVILSIVNPSLFLSVAELTENESSFDGRGYGFYLQPNVCAASLTLLFFLWLFARKPGRLTRICFTVPYLLVIFLTGSRGGILMSVFLVFCYGLLAGPGWNLSLLSARLIRLGLVGGAGLALIICAVFALGSRLTVTGTIETFNRIKSLAEYRDLAQGDDSVRDRFDVQLAYLSMIADHPFLGYGIGSAPVMRERRLLERSSHNTFLEYTFSYGIVGLVVWIVVIAMTWEDCVRLRWIEYRKIDLLLFGVLFLACMVSNTVLANRVLFILLGWILARRYPHAGNAVAQTWPADVPSGPPGELAAGTPDPQRES